MKNKNYRIVNLKFEIDGLHFDAAVDCDWQMHAYEIFETKYPHEDYTPIEVYCFDHPDWDVKMIYQKLPNRQQPEEENPRLIGGWLGHTDVNLSNIIEETKVWMREMLGEE